MKRSDVRDLISHKLSANRQPLAAIKWQADRKLAGTIHKQIKKILGASSLQLEDIEGIVCFKGPGSFTGLRIGLSVANALAYALNIPIVASRNKDWLKKGIKDLQAGKNEKIAIPFYGRPPNITQPRK